MLTAQLSTPITYIPNASFNCFKKSASNVYSLEKQNQKNPTTKETKPLNFLTIAAWKLFFPLTQAVLFHLTHLCKTPKTPF